MLDVRPLQCYKCMEVGYVQQHCRSGVDKSRLCYKCGKGRHIAQKRSEKASKCAICAENGDQADRRSGGNACPRVKKRKNTPPARPVAGSKAKKAAATVTAAAPDGAQPESANDGVEAQPINIMD